MSADPLVPPGVRRLTVLTPEAERVRRAGVMRPSVPTGLPAGRKPDWLKVRLSSDETFAEVGRLMDGLGLNTVCAQAACPNIHECWSLKEATFLIGGEDCTRRCGFCQIRTGRPVGLDREEPARVAEAVARLGLRFAVVTMVARDDLEDGGAWLVAETIRAIRARTPEVGVEVLPSDFGYGRDPALGAAALDAVADARPDVFAFNLETTRRLFPIVRPAFDYDRGLEFLALARERMPAKTAIKSNLIAGMGETDDELRECMRDLAGAGVATLTIGQYLQPSAQHLRLDRYVPPETFAELKRHGEEELGFAHVEAGPLVRSSYHAGQQAIDAEAWRPSGASTSA
jgi:lipoic acid synthetase